MWLILSPLILIIAGLAWWFAVQSRKHYVCPSCGNSVVVEQMSASSCNICGAPLTEIGK